MIRRNIVRGDRDGRVVKWALVAAGFALSLGGYAEVTLARAADEVNKVVAESVAEPDADRVSRIAG
jgi:hypothetical protein